MFNIYETPIDSLITLNRIALSRQLNAQRISFQGIHAILMAVEELKVALKGRGLLLLTFSLI